MTGETSLIVFCEVHRRSCYVQLSGWHLPGIACTCEVVDGKFVVSESCIVDRHKQMRLEGMAEW